MRGTATSPAGIGIQRPYPQCQQKVGGDMSKDLPERASVVVIGGGVIGASIAFHLAESGVADVVLVEKDELACSGPLTLAAVDASVNSITTSCSSAATEVAISMHEEASFVQLCGGDSCTAMRRRAHWGCRRERNDKEYRWPRAGLTV